MEKGYKITIKDPSQYEVVEVDNSDLKITELKREVIFDSGEETIDKLTIRDVWNSHGKLVDFNHRHTYKNVRIRVEEVTTEYKYPDLKPVTFTTNELFINDVKYEGSMSVENLRGTYASARIDSIVGEG